MRPSEPPTTASSLPPWSATTDAPTRGSGTGTSKPWPWASKPSASETTSPEAPTPPTSSTRPPSSTAAACRLRAASSSSSFALPVFGSNSVALRSRVRLSVDTCSPPASSTWPSGSGVAVW